MGTAQFGFEMEPNEASDRLTAALTAENSPTEVVVETPAVVDTPAVATESQGHPAWQEVLTHIPAALHDSVRPALEKWDSGVKTRLEQYTPYQEFTAVPPEDLRAAKQLYDLMSNDPATLYQKMAEHYGYGTTTPTGQGSPGQQAQEPTVDLGEFSDDLTSNPQFQALQKQQQQMIDMFNQQQAQQQQAQAEQWLGSKQSAATEALAKQGITPDWDYILNKAASLGQQTKNNDVAFDKAVTEYAAMVNRFKTPVATTTAPIVASPSGAVPSSQVNAASMTNDQRKQLMAQSLKQLFSDKG